MYDEYNGYTLKRGPFVYTLTSALDIPIGARSGQRTVTIDDGSGPVEYWWKDGAADGQLVLKTIGSSGPVDPEEKNDLILIKQED